MHIEVVRSKRRLSQCTLFSTQASRIAWILLPALVAFTNVDAHAGTKRHVEPWGGYSIEVPDGWQAIRRKDNHFAYLFRQADGISAASYIEFKRMFTSDTHAKAAGRFLDAMQQDSPDIRSRIVADEFKTESGIEGTRVRCPMASPESPSGVLLSVIYYLEFGETIFTLTWQQAASNSSSSDEDILRLVRTFDVEEPEPLQVLDDGSRRMNESLGGYSCLVPDGWEAAPTKNGLRLCVHTDEVGARSTISIGRNPKPSEKTLDDVSEKQIKRFGETFGTFKRLDKGEFQTDSGVKGLRYVMRWRKQSTDETFRLVWYFFDDPEGTLECFTLTIWEHGTTFDPVFDAFARSLRIERFQETSQ